MAAQKRGRGRTRRTTPERYYLENAPEWSNASIDAHGYPLYRATGFHRRKKSMPVMLGWETRDDFTEVPVLSDPTEGQLTKFGFQTVQKIRGDRKTLEGFGERYYNHDVWLIDGYLLCKVRNVARTATIERDENGNATGVDLGDWVQVFEPIDGITIEARYKIPGYVTTPTPVQTIHGEFWEAGDELEIEVAGGVPDVLRMYRAGTCTTVTDGDELYRIGIEAGFCAA